MRKQTNNTISKPELIKAILKANFPDGKAVFSLGEFTKMIGESSKTTAKYHLNKLEQEGFLKFTSRSMKGNRELKNVVLFGQAKENNQCDMEIQFQNDTLHMCNSKIGYVISIEEVSQELMILPSTAQKIIKANQKQFDHYLIEKDGKQYLNGSGLIALMTKINLDRAKPEKVLKLKQFQMFVIENLIALSNGQKKTLSQQEVQEAKESVADLVDITPEAIHLLFMDIQKKIDLVIANNNSLRDKLKKEEVKTNILNQNLNAYRQEIGAMREKILTMANM